ncbi:alanine:cation symporter family protein, partial [Bacillus velezensis]|uniref:alanine:cation symporter family protein n=1 Tax=Bacillus velezensis TaxID=492670 RepID=UPI0011A9B118
PPTATTSHPLKHPLIQPFPLLTHTLLISTTTPLIILFSHPYHHPPLTPIPLSHPPFTHHVTASPSPFLPLLILFFRFTALIANYYYPQTN